MTGRGFWRKEAMEAVRTYKVLFLPVVFLLLAISQPLAIHFMPDILDQAGLPEGTIIEIPVPPPAEVVATVFDAFNQMGVLIVVLAVMGAIGREIELGQTAYVLTLGISRVKYVLTKWVVLSILATASVLVGTWGAAWYTAELFGAVSWGHVTVAALSYSLYAVFVVSLTLAMSAAFTNSWAAGLSAIGVVIVLGILSVAVPGIAAWLPTQAGNMAREVLAGETLTGAGRGLLITAGWITAAVVLAHTILRRREI